MNKSNLLYHLEKERKEGQLTNEQKHIILKNTVFYTIPYMVMAVYWVFFWNVLLGVNC